MNQTYQVNLMFNANTTQAKTALQDLQMSMNNLTSASTTLPITPQLQQAQQAAAQLKVVLNDAVNINTGKFDLSKFNTSLNRMGMDLQTLKTNLTSMGPAGQQAFMSLSQSVMTAEIPTKRLNANLLALGQTLKNTVRWQLSSSMIMGFTTAIRDAYNYAQDLNESLNNIRIVTGQNIAAMDIFAEKANKAAQRLSTSTLDYTNAALIYYQQGLNDADVAARAEVTLKLANVTRQSAEIVSDQMTAIWNNFDDGSKSLEHYADVLTALGATTASSSDEIARGLEKFAAIAETVGLSYEYAAAALATVTAETRQSADVVGTAFKTIFARMEGLKLGETLEDGTDLNKYSEALASVGVNIKDQQGNLREMDDILDDIGAKWETLNKDQQVALAQSVAGVRQYNQFISLFDNWDTMKDNLRTASNSYGELEKQQERYQESWEAASKRVRAAAQAIYKDLLDDKFFIKLTDSIAHVLRLIDNFLDGIGGAGGALAGLSQILLHAFAGPAAKGLENMVYNFKSFTGQAQQEAISIQQTMMGLTEGMQIVNPSAVNESTAMSSAMTAQVELSHQLVTNKAKMTEAEQVQAQMIIEQNKAYGDQLIKLGQVADAANQNKENSRQRILEIAKDANVAKEIMDSIDNDINVSENIIQQLNELDKKFLDGQKTIKEYNLALKELRAEAESQGVNTVVGAIDDRGKISSSDAYKKKVVNTDYSKMGIQERLNAGAKYAGQAGDIDLNNEELQNYAASARDAAVAVKELSEGQNALANNTDLAKKKMQGFGTETASWSKNLVTIAQGVSGLCFALNAFKGIWDTLNNSEMTVWEKMLSVFSSLSMVVIMMSNAMKGLKLLVQADTIATGINTVAKLLNWAATKKNAGAAREEAAGKKLSAKETNKDTIAEVANTASKKGGGIKGAFKNLGKSLLNFAKAYGGVIAGIAIAVASVAIAVNHYNKDAIAAKKAAEQAKEASEMYSQAAESYQSFQDKVSSYNSAVEGLKELEKGTMEYRDAVLKANDSVLELINSNQNLKYTVNEDGLIVLDEESLEEAKKTQLEMLHTAQQTKILAQQNAMNAKLRAEQTEFNRTYADGKGWSSEDTAWLGGGIGAGIGGGLAIGTLIGGSAGPIGALIGAAIGAAVGGIGAAISKDSEEEEDRALEILTKAYNEKGNAIFTDEGIKDELKNKGLSKDLIDSLAENASETQKMVEAISNNEKATIELTKAMVQSKDPKKFNNDNLSKEEQDKLYDAYSKDLNKRTEELYTSKWKDKGKFGGGITDEEAQKAYAALQGWDPNLVKNKGGNTAIYYDKDGKEVHLSDETVRRALAQHEAEQELDKQDKQRILDMEQIKSISVDGVSVGDTLASAIGDTGISDEATVEQIRLIEEQQEQIKSQITDTMAQSVGYENADAYIKDLTKDVKNYSQAMSEVGHLLRMNLDGRTLENMDQLSLKAMQQLYKSTAGMSDYQKDQFVDDMNNFINSVAEEDQGALMEQLFNTDWTSIESVEELEKQMDKMGSDIDLADDRWNNFIHSLEKGADIPVLDQMIQLINGIDKIKDWSKNEDAQNTVFTEEEIQTNGYNKEDFIITGYKKEGDKDVPQYSYIGGDIEGLKNRHFQEATDQIMLDATELKGLQGIFNQEIYDKTTTAEAIDELGKAQAATHSQTSVQTFTPLDYGGNPYEEKTDDSAEYRAKVDEQTHNKVLTFLDEKGGRNKFQDKIIYEEKGSYNWEGSKEQQAAELYNAIAADPEKYGLTEEDLKNMTKQVGKKEWKQDHIWSTDIKEVDGMLQGNVHIGGWVTTQQLNAIDTDSDVYKNWVGTKDKMGELEKSVGGMEALASQFTNVFQYEQGASELKDVTNESADGLNVYQKGLLDLAQGYEVCADEQKAYLKELRAAEPDVEKITKAEKDLIKALKNAAWHDATKEVKGYMDQLEDTIDTHERAQIMANIATTLNKALNLAVNREWVEQNLLLIQQWYNANGEEAQRLALKIQSLASLESMDFEAIDIEVDGSEAMDETELLLEKYNIIKGIIEDDSIVIRADGTVDVTKVVEDLVGLKADAETVARVLAAFGQTDINISGFGDELTDISSFDLSTPEGIAALQEWLNGLEKWEGGIEVLGSYVPPVDDVDMDHVGDGSSGGKKKKSKPKKPAERKKEKDEIERYHEIKKAIEQHSRAVDRLAKAKDEAYGADKLKAMEAEIEATRELIALNEIYLDEIRQNLALDKQTAKSFGIEFDDSTGLITNYDEIIRQKMEEWYAEEEAITKRENEWQAARDANENYDEDEKIKDEIDEDREANNKAYEDFKEAIQQYEESQQLFEEAMDEMVDQYRQIAEKILEGIEYKIQTNIEFNTQEISILDLQASLLQDDFLKVAEVVHLAGEEFQFLKSSIDYNAEGIESLLQNYADGKITLSDVSTSLSTLIPDLLSSLKELISLDQEMMEAYGNAFDTMEEEFSEFLTDLDYGVEKLQYIRDLSSLLGKESNNTWMGTILNAQYKTASDRLTASTKWYDLSKKEYDALYSRYMNEKDVLAANNPKELEMLEEKLKVAETKMQEADAQRLEDMQAVGEIAQEILQNNLDKARKTLEQNILGSSLDDYMTQLDRLSKKQEEYLTNTNKLYETSKLMRQAQLDMDKTDSLRAKEKYKEYMDYIGQLKEAGQVSQHELSIAQAKYELLQAEIALEEAQNNKNSMRLVRGADGNWSYMYTANQDQVSQAQQNLEDKQNALYNIGLEGAQDYQSKAAEILQEANETFATLQEQYQTGEIASREEFEQKMLEARDYYYGLLQNYDTLYHVSLDTMQENSHNNTIDYQLSNIEIFGKFAENVDNYLDDVNESFDDYDEKVDVIEQEVGQDLNSLATKTGEVNTKTEELIKTINEEFLPAAADELLAVRETTSEWGKKRKTLYDIIEANKVVIQQMKEIQELQLGRKEDLAGYLIEKMTEDSTLGSEDRLVQEIIGRRWDKMGGADNTNYAALMEGLDPNSAEYRAYAAMREYKIARTDWNALKQQTLAENPNADVSWIDNMIQEKLNLDWEKRITQYVTQNPGVRFDDPYLREMLDIRALTAAHETKSNNALLIQLGKYIIGEEAIIDNDNVSSNESTEQPSEVTVTPTYPSIGDQVKLKSEASFYGSKSDKGGGVPPIPDFVKNRSAHDVIEVDKNMNQVLIGQGSAVTGWVNLTDLVGYKTGGYTGIWGPEGKLALLHEKELVLNAHDTENILASVELLRGISDSLIGNAGATTSMLATILQASSANGTHDVVQQTISIEASFPGVQSAVEIEEALNNLVNDAVQYASVKKL